MVGLNTVDTHLAEVLSTAAGEVWVSSHMQTEGTLIVFDWVYKLTLIATGVGTCHFFSTRKMGRFHKNILVVTCMSQ